MGACGRVRLRHYAENSKVVGSIPVEVIFSIYLILPGALGPGVYSATNRHEYQKHKNTKVRPVRRADNLIAICEPIV
jgi:hypothetical protein